MRHRKHTFKIGRTDAHRRAMLANMVCSLFEHGQIETSVVKAKEARRLAERMITKAKNDSLHQRRIAISRLQQKDIVKKLFAEIAPQFAERAGGYTRIIRLGKRIGDAADMCILQLVSKAEEAPKKAKKEKADAVKAEPEKKAE
ncbi:MAG: 50S ribosomal protein L17 [Lentisphaerae bacterium GWF2_52_8]|nr:MAG: 50S ribosomal protein L17 [Lentisphaerae bacterium GWF2_52_8]